MPEIWLDKLTMPLTEPTEPRGAIMEGMDQPTGAAAARPPIEMLIQRRARGAVWAWAAPRMPRPKAVPVTRMVLRTRLGFQPRWMRWSDPQPAARSVTVAKSQGTPV